MYLSISIRTNPSLICKSKSCVAVFDFSNFFQWLAVVCCEQTKNEGSHQDCDEEDWGLKEELKGVVVKANVDPTIIYYYVGKSNLFHCIELINEIHWQHLLDCLRIKTYLTLSEKEHDG